MIVILSIIGIILEEMRTNVIPINPTIIRVMRVLRIARGTSFMLFIYHCESDNEKYSETYH